MSVKRISMEGTPVDILEKRYSTTPFQGAVGYGDIMRIVEGTRFYLRSAHQILTALSPDQPDWRVWTTFCGVSNLAYHPTPWLSQSCRYP
jgi:hypothetical protein